MSATGVATKPTSLKLPSALKTQLELDAQRAGLTLHAHMIQTLTDSARRTRQREAFALDSMEALRDMKANGLGYELGDVRAYFSQLASYRKGLEPKPADLLPTQIG